MEKKNKSKAKKNGKIPPKPQRQPQYPAHWYYMAVSEMTVEEIRLALDAQEYNIEIWKEAGVLEIGVTEKASVDIEECELDLGDEYSNEFLKQNQVRSLFYVTINTEEEAACVDVMKKIAGACGGMFCGDTEDFTPMIRM